MLHNLLDVIHSTTNLRTHPTLQLHCNLIDPITFAVAIVTVPNQHLHLVHNFAHFRTLHIHNHPNLMNPGLIVCVPIEIPLSQAAVVVVELGFMVVDSLSVTSSVSSI